MTLQTLALVVLIGLLGPLLAVPRALHVPVVLGELAGGIAFGPTGFNRLHAHDPTFTFLADIGFGLVMFVAGSHVPVRDPRLRSAFRTGVARAIGIGVLAVVVGIVLSRVFNTGHAALYAVLMASSSAALALPILDGLGTADPAVLQLLPQIAIADAACIVALPLAIDPHHAVRAALGAIAVLAAAGLLFIGLRFVEQHGYRRRLHALSEQRKFALELRFSLVILCSLAALAIHTHVSIMLAGFSFGLAAAGIGEPRRLARQLFAVTEGLFGPLFFVWVGASLDLRQLGHHPSFIWLGVVLGVGALAVHVAMRATGQPIAIGALAAAQLGVPVAAVTVGGQLHLLKPGESSALLLGALVTIVVVAITATRIPTGATAGAGPVTPATS